MSTSSKRSPPDRAFNNYVLTKVISSDVGITHISEDVFNTVHNVDVGYPAIDDGVSDFVDIGFDFQFHGVTYKRMVISTNGYVVLADPFAASATAALLSVITAASGSYNNEGINLSNTTDSIILCPWFDDLRNRFYDVTHASLGYTSDEIYKLQHGMMSIPTTVSAKNNAVGIYRETNSPYGRRTIIRWNSLSDYTLNASSFLKFESVIYENGMIEFRYVPKQNIRINELEDATVGIFKNSTYMRDYSKELDYGSDTRVKYKYGGSQYDASYWDGKDGVFRNYTWLLTAANHWPGQANAGAILRFSPPQNRRKILPRLLIREQDVRTSFPESFKNIATNSGKIEQFDDRRTINYVTATVDFPTSLQRYHGGSDIHISERQNAFSTPGNDFNVTTIVSKQATEQIISIEKKDYIAPFSDQQTIVIDESNSFFTAGSDILLSEKLQQPLWSKTKISLSLPVDNKTIMFDTTSSLYYYNAKTNAWSLPETLRNKNDGFDIDNPANYVSLGQILEDHRGFGPIGNLLASGSNDTLRLTTRFGTDSHINSSFELLKYTEVLNQKYSKTFTLNPDYHATNSEKFSLPINRPFLIEKATIELPIEAGSGWFDDRTQPFLPIASSALYGSFDFAGPALTVALLNQISTGNKTNPSMRDIILTGTITHQYDDMSEIAINRFDPVLSSFKHFVRPKGFRTWGKPSAVIYANNSTGSFTGSVKILTEPLVSNGAILKFSKDFDNSASPNFETNRQNLLNFLKIEKFPMISGSASDGEYAAGLNVAYINAFGRACTGFEPAGRSVYGREYSTSQGILDKNKKINNPFYVTGTQYTLLSSTIAGLNRFNAFSAFTLESHFRSPYLVMPNDNIVLALSKTRPFYYEFLGNPEFSSSIKHDIKLSTGSINITLYGSMLRENGEFHDTLPACYASNAIHGIIGDEPVLDQFEIFYREEYVGTTCDDYITGTLVLKKHNYATNKTEIITANSDTINSYGGARGKAFSKTYAREAPLIGSTTAEKAIESSLGNALQPWYEKVGTNRVMQLFDKSERFYDTLLPSIHECFKLDGSDLYSLYTSELSSVLFDDGVTGWENGITTVAILGPLHSHVSTGSKVDNPLWHYSFPFEPRYSTSPRKLNNTKNELFIKTAITLGYDGFTTNTLSNPVRANGLVVMSHKRNFHTYHKFNWSIYTDMNRSLTQTFTAMSPDDTVKVLFGYGDICDATSLPKAGGDDNDNSYGPYGLRNAPSAQWSVSSGTAGRTFADLRVGPIIRGWKYGIYSGLPSYSKTYFRNGRFGQLRDMLEQRQYSVFVNDSTEYSSIKQTAMTKFGQLKTKKSPAPVSIRFIDSQGNTTNPERTWSQNLHFEATSSVPYFDGEIKNRNPIDTSLLNVSVFTV